MNILAVIDKYIYILKPTIMSLSAILCATDRRTSATRHGAEGDGCFCPVEQGLSTRGPVAAAHPTLVHLLARADL